MVHPSSAVTRKDAVRSFFGVGFDAQNSDLVTPLQLFSMRAASPHMPEELYHVAIAHTVWK